MCALIEPRDPEPPPAVEEAEATLQSYRVRLGASWFGGMVASLVTASQLLGLYPAETLPWLLAPTAVIGALLVHPLGRRVGMARRILRRWEEIRTDRVLRPPPREDPRVRAARMMADRIVADPASTVDVEDVVLRIVAQIEVAVTDLRTIDFTSGASPAVPLAADLRTDLEVRIARLLSGLAELHRALVVREAVSVRAGISDLRDLLAQLQAENEVELMLRGDASQLHRSERPVT
jgi:hypothetical protein